jgi:hypothetical protein
LSNDTRKCLSSPTGQCGKYANGLGAGQIDILPMKILSLYTICLQDRTARLLVAAQNVHASCSFSYTSLWPACLMRKHTIRSIVRSIV